MQRIDIRAARPGDPAVAHLAELDSAPVPAGHMLVAEIDGRAIAAVSQDGGTAVADPFERTGVAVDLLVRRASAMRAEGVARSLRAWRRGERRERRAPVVATRPARLRRADPSIQGAGPARG